MTAPQTVPPLPLSLRDDLDRLDLDPDAVRVEPVRSRKAPGSVRVWMGEDLVAGTCRDCRALTPAEDLVRDRRRLGGRALWCSPCLAAVSAERYAADPEARREYARRYRAENLDAVRESDRRYRAANPDAVRESNRRYHEENAEAVRERKRRYRKENAEAIRERRRAYHARLSTRSDAEILADREALHPDGVKECAACRVSLPLADFFTDRRQPSGLCRRCRPCDAEAQARRLRRRVEILHPGASRCYICRAAPFEEVEHVLPRRYGGDDSPANLAPSCRDCNRGPDGKHDRDPRDFLAERLGVEESFEVLRERLPASLLIGEPLGDYAARRAEAPLDLDEDDEQPAPAPATSTGRDGFHVLDVDALLGDAHRAV